MRLDLTKDEIRLIRNCLNDRATRLNQTPAAKRQGINTVKGEIINCDELSDKIEAQVDAAETVAAQRAQRARIARIRGSQSLPEARYEHE